MSARKPVGMYGETPRVKVGAFTICMQGDASVWIEVDEGPDAGEGGEFPLSAFTEEVCPWDRVDMADVEKVRRFYAKWF